MPFFKPRTPGKNYNPFEIVALILVFSGGILISFAWLGVGLTAGGGITPFLPFFLVLLVGAALFGGVVKSHPVVLFGVFMTGYAPLQILLGIALIQEGYYSVLPWGLLQAGVLLVAALGILIGRAIAQSAGRRMRRPSIS